MRGYPATFSFTGAAALSLWPKLGKRNLTGLQNEPE